MKIAKKLLIITLGTLIMSLAVVCFYIPNNVAAGGVSGISIVLHNIFPFLNIGLTTLVLNIFLFIIGFLVLGKEFGFLTLYGSIAYSTWIIILGKFIVINEPLINELIVSIICGGLLTGTGMAFIYYQNASSGGTDILAKILHKYTKIDIGKSGFIIDGLVVLGVFIFIGPGKGVYSIMATLITAFLIDELIKGFEVRIKMTVITSETEKVNKYITEHLNRGSTIYKILGGYSNQEKEQIVTILHRSEYLKMKEYIESIDKRAFVYISTVNEVIGEGFSERKDND